MSSGDTKYTPVSVKETDEPPVEFDLTHVEEEKQRKCMYVSWIISIIFALLYIFDWPRPPSNTVPSMPTRNVESLETSETLNKMLGMLEKLQGSNEKLSLDLQNMKLLDVKQTLRTSTKRKSMMGIKEIMDFDFKLFSWSNRNNDTEKYSDENIVNDMEREGIANFNDRQHMKFNALGEVEDICTHMQSFAQGDDEKYVCNPSDMFDEGCIIFSIGCNGQWAFEESVYARTNCEIHTFDCTGSWSPPAEIADRTHFHKICLGDTDKQHSTSGENMWSYGQIVKKFSPKKAPKYLKIDIEGFEYGVFRNMLRDSNILSYIPEQIAVEIHTRVHWPALTWRHRQKSLLELRSWKVMMQLVGGYHLIHREDNPLCWYCSEILLMRHPDFKPKPISYPDFLELLFDSSI